MVSPYQQPYDINDFCLQFARELVLSRLKDLKNFRTYKLNVSVDREKDILAHLYMAQDKLSVANKAQRGTTSMSFSTEEKLDNHVRKETKLMGSLFS